MGFIGFVRNLFGGGSTTNATSATTPAPAPAPGVTPPTVGPPTPAPTSVAPGAGGAGPSVSGGRGVGEVDMDRIHGAYTSGHTGTKEKISPEELRRLEDQKKAQQELKGQFQIVPADFVGPRLPNQVTQQEFEKLANNYSDIRTGNSNIKLDTAGMDAKKEAEFREKTMKDFSSMLQTGSGRDLIDQLAHAQAKDGTARTTTIHGIANPLGAEAAASDPAKAADRGNGVGTNMTVNYAPGADVNVPGAKDQWLPVRSDVALFHEMTHALHGVSGTRKNDMVADKDLQPGDPKGRTKLEEYATVGLGPHANDAITENRYRNERRLLAGRVGARPGDELPGMGPRTNYSPTF
jgi:hypothetical protein